MDAFLRRVIAQRELEQEEAILAFSLTPSDCRGCGERMNLSDHLRHYCTSCGGSKADAKYKRRQRLVTLTLEATPMADCSVCAKPLRADNRRGAHASCLTGGSPAPSPTNDVKRRFRVVTEAFGIDGDKLLNEFMEGWLERAHDSVKGRSGDDL